MRLATAVSSFIGSVVSATCFSQLWTKCTRASRCRRIFELLQWVHNIIGVGGFCSRAVSAINLDTCFLTSVSKFTRLWVLLECLDMLHCLRRGCLIKCRWIVLLYFLHAPRTLVFVPGIILTAGFWYSCIPVRQLRTSSPFVGRAWVPATLVLSFGLVCEDQSVGFVRIFWGQANADKLAHLCSIVECINWSVVPMVRNRRPKE